MNEDRELLLNTLEIVKISLERESYKDKARSQITIHGVWGVVIVIAILCFSIFFSPPSVDIDNQNTNNNKVVSK